MKKNQELNEKPDQEQATVIKTSGVSPENT